MDNSISFRKSSYSGGQGGDCVAVGSTDVVHVIDTKRPEGDRLKVPASSWSAFTARLKK